MQQTSLSFFQEIFTHFQCKRAYIPDELDEMMSKFNELISALELGEMMGETVDCFVSQCSYAFIIVLFDLINLPACALQEKMLEKIHRNLSGNENMDNCSLLWCLSHQKFALTTIEQVNHINLTVVLKDFLDTVET